MVVTSDDPGASAAIGRFGAGAQRWLVSVLMVSEGVDIPRLRVGVYATAARTELFFRQVVGRFIRRTRAPAEQMSHLLMPADPALKVLATRIEEERDHVLEAKPEGEDREAVERGEAGAGYEALSSSGARVDDLITVAPGENFALFGAPEPASSVHLDAFGGHVAGASVATPSEPTHARRERLRAERATLVAALARRTGASHREINARLNRDVGAPSVGKATLDQLERANALLAKRVGRR
jgi:superfamily II DNA or RNA helicase